MRRGLTPERPVAANGGKYEMHYYVHSLDRAAFVEELQEDGFAGNIHLHLDDEPEEKLDLESVLSQCESGTHVYFCGPTEFMEEVRVTAGRYGGPVVSLHFEHGTVTIGATAGVSGLPMGEKSTAT